LINRPEACQYRRMKTITYVCEECGAKATAAEGAPIPVCCGLPMKPEPLPGCVMTDTAEQARSARADEPCDDDTGRRKH
jgi:hypothetical protein